MKIKTDPRDIFKELADGKEYNQNHGLYDTIEKNRRFYLGDQWAGVNAPNLMKPVFNIIHRVVTYFVAMIVSDDVGVHISPFDTTEEKKAVADIISDQVGAVIERTDLKAKARTNVKDACTDGDTAIFVNFDPSIDTGQTAKGDVDIEIIDNAHLIFGNPYSDVVQKQPYILVVQRLFTEQVKDYAESRGVAEDKINDIRPDSEDSELGVNYQTDDKLTTVVTKFWKEKKKIPKIANVGGQQIEYEEEVESVHYTKVCAGCVLDKPIDLDYRRYPIAYFSWEKVKNSYHGRSPITGLIPNQIFINKIYAMCMVYMTNMGFPKVFYDQNKISTLTNNVAKATAITNMDMAGKVIDAVKAPDFSNQIIQLVDSTIAYTKDFMGASDAALGNISNPNNTSAIVAVQEASSVPLQIQKLDYYQFFEDIVRAIIDVISVRYGTRRVRISEAEAKALGLYQTDAMGQPMVDQMGQPMVQSYADIDFSSLRTANYDVDVEIGQSSYWSEATQVQTMGNLFDKGVITNPVTYLEGIPDKYIPNKQKIIDEIKTQQAQAQMLQSAQNQLAMMQAQQGINEMEAQQAQPNVTAGMKDGADNRGDANNEQLQQTYAKSKEYYQ